MASAFFSKDLFLGYTCRLFHIVPVIALGGHTIFSYLYQNNQRKQISQSELVFIITNSILLTIAGFLNQYLLKPEESMGGEFKMPWIAIVHTKLLLTLLFFFPIVQKIAGYDETAALTIRFWITVLFLLLSPMLRFYREYFTAMNGGFNKLKNMI